MADSSSISLSKSHITPRDTNKPRYTRNKKNVRGQKSHVRRPLYPRLPDHLGHSRKASIKSSQILTTPNTHNLEESDAEVESDTPRTPEPDEHLSGARREISLVDFIPSHQKPRLARRGTSLEFEIIPRTRPVLAFEDDLDLESYDLLTNCHNPDDSGDEWEDIGFVTEGKGPARLVATSALSYSEIVTGSFQVAPRTNGR